MNQNIQPNVAEPYIELVDEIIQQTKSGETLVITYNGSDTLTFRTTSSTIFSVKEVTADVAQEIEKHLRLKHFFITKFRISKFAFSATHTKRVPYPR